MFLTCKALPVDYDGGYWSADLTLRSHHQFQSQGQTTRPEAEPFARWFKQETHEVIPTWRVTSPHWRPLTSDGERLAHRPKLEGYAREETPWLWGRPGGQQNVAHGNRQHWDSFIGFFYRLNSGPLNNLHVNVENLKPIPKQPVINSSFLYSNNVEVLVLIK